MKLINTENNELENISSTDIAKNKSSNTNDIYCKSCGKKIDGDSKFCMYCGVKLIKKEIENDNKNTKIIYNKNDNVIKKPRLSTFAIVLIISIIVIALGTITFFAFSPNISNKVISKTVNNIIYTFDKNEKIYYVSGITNSNIVNVIIEDKIDSYPVTKIGSIDPGRLDIKPFKNCANLKTLVLPNTIKEIGVEAFAYCSSLSEINIPQGVTEIGISCFIDCKELKTLKIPYSVKSIGFSAFSGCSKLSTINIPSGINSLGDSTFLNCSSLEFILLPDSITYLGDSLFSGCTSLEYIRIPNKVQTIPKYFTFDCEKMATVYIPKSVTLIRRSAFGFTYSRLVPNIHYEGNKKDWSAVIIEEGNNQYKYESNFTYYSYPSQTTIIPVL